MGMQITIIASKTDEVDLLGFLIGSANVQLFKREAPTRKELFVDGLAPYEDIHRYYYIWNKAYKWKPKIVQGDPKFHDGQKWCYIENPGHGPVLHFTRTNMKNFLEKGPGNGAFSEGRLYWAKYNRQKGFAKWYESINRWVRKHAVNLSEIPSWSWWCLPDAHAQWLSRKLVSK